MTEVGLLPFARIALQVSRAVLPRYRSRFSKRQFTQPQLLAILCLMRYEDWTFREAEVRLGEHRELRQVLGLGSVPDFTTLYRFLQRLDDQTIDSAVDETVRRLRGSLRQKRKRARVAVDATGFAQGARKHLLCAAHASSRAETAAVAPLAEVGGRRGFGSPVRVVADRAARSVERCANLPAVVAAASRTNTHRAGAGRCRIRQREESHLHPPAAGYAAYDRRRSAGRKPGACAGCAAEMRRAFPRRLYRRLRPGRKPVLLRSNENSRLAPRVARCPCRCVKRCCSD